MESGVGWVPSTRSKALLGAWLCDKMCGWGAGSTVGKDHEMAVGPLEAYAGDGAQLLGLGMLGGERGA